MSSGGDTATPRGALAAALVAALPLAGCAVRVPPDRGDYLAAHPETPAERQQQILAGEVALGMTPAEVEAALGAPLHRRRMEADGKAVEIWTYPGALVFRSSALRSRGDQDFLAALLFREGALVEIQDR